MGKEFGVCFKVAQKIPTEEADLNEIVVDDIKVQRKLVRESRKTSGSCEVKEYRFVQDKPLSATVATVPLETIG